MSKVDKTKKAHKGLLNWKRGKKDKKSDFQFLQDKTHFSEKELTIIWNQFHKEIPGGLLTKPHFHMLISSVTGIEDKKLVDMMFHAFDSEDLGYITYRQWVLAFSVMTRGTLDEKLRFTFNLYDTEHRGSLVLNQFADLVDATDPGAAAELKAHFLGEKLDFANFCSAIAQRPSILVGFRSLFTRNDFRRLVFRSENPTSLSTSESHSESASMFTNWAASTANQRSIVRSGSHDASLASRTLSSSTVSRSEPMSASMSDDYRANVYRQRRRPSETSSELVDGVFMRPQKAGSTIQYDPDDPPAPEMEPETEVDAEDGPTAIPYIRETPDDYVPTQPGRKTIFSKTRMSEMKSDIIEKRREIRMEKQQRKIEKQMGKQGVRKSLTLEKPEDEDENETQPGTPRSGRDVRPDALARKPSRKEKKEEKEKEKQKDPQKQKDVKKDKDAKDTPTRLKAPNVVPLEVPDEVGSPEKEKYTPSKKNKAVQFVARKVHKRQNRDGRTSPWLPSLDPEAFYEPDEDGSSTDSALHASESLDPLEI